MKFIGSSAVTVALEGGQVNASLALPHLLAEEMHTKAVLFNLPVGKKMNHFHLLPPPNVTFQKSFLIFRYGGGFLVEDAGIISK